GAGRARGQGRGEEERADPGTSCHGALSDARRARTSTLCRADSATHFQCERAPRPPPLPLDGFAAGGFAAGFASPDAFAAPPSGFAAPSPDAGAAGAASFFAASW